MVVKLLKLVSGETVVADVTPVGDGRMKLTTPVTLRMYPSQIAGGAPTLGFAPFPEMSDMDNPQPILLEPIHVVYSSNPASDIVSEYQRLITEVGASSSGIITG